MLCSFTRSYYLCNLCFFFYIPCIHVYGKIVSQITLRRLIWLNKSCFSKESRRLTELIAITLYRLPRLRGSHSNCRHLRCADHLDVCVVPTVSRAALLRMACNPFCFLSAVFHLLIVVTGCIGNKH